jgi:hypothetical protein
MPGQRVVGLPSPGRCSPEGETALTTHRYCVWKYSPVETQSVAGRAGGRATAPRRSPSALAGRRLAGAGQPPCSWRCVLLPTDLAAGTYGLIASDHFVSESRFVGSQPAAAAISGSARCCRAEVRPLAGRHVFGARLRAVARCAGRAGQEAEPCVRSFSSESIDPFNRFTALEWDSASSRSTSTTASASPSTTTRSRRSPVLTVRAYTAETRASQRLAAADGRAPRSTSSTTAAATT